MAIRRTGGLALAAVRLVTVMESMAGVCMLFESGDLD